MKRWFLLILAAAALPALAILATVPIAGKAKAAGPKAAQEFDEKKFKKEIKSYDHDVRVTQIKTLDPNVKKQFDLLLKKGLKDRDWFVRDAAKFQLAKVSDEKMLEDFKRKHQDQLAIDGGGYLAFLAPTRVNLTLAEERWPEIRFSSTREH